MILDCAGFAHRGDQRITSVSTQAKPNYSMKSRAATHNRAPPCGDSVKHHRPIEYAADLTPVVAAEAAGASWNARRIFASREQYGGTALAASFPYVTGRYAEVLERTRKRLGSLGSSVHLRRTSSISYFRSPCSSPSLGPQLELQ